MLFTRGFFFQAFYSNIKQVIIVVSEIKMSSKRKELESDHMQIHVSEEGMCVVVGPSVSRSDSKNSKRKKRLRV